MSTDSVATLNLEVNTQASLDRMREFENSMASVADGADHAAARVDNMGTMVKNTAVAMGAAFGGMKIAGFLGDAVKESAMFREDVAQFEWVFRKVRGEGEKLIETLTSADYGRSSREAMQMTMSLASMLKGLNLTDKAAAQLSGEFAKMAIDIGSFMSKDPSDVMNAMQSAIMGETMALRTYGVHLTEASIKSVIAEKAANGITYATEREARAFAILSEAQRQQNDAIGDFAVEGGNYRAQINQLTNNITALKVSIGDAFREDVEASLRSLNKFLKWVDEIDPATKKAVVVFGTIGTVLTGMTAAYKVGSVAITMYNASKLASARAAERAAIAQSTEAISTNALTGAISVQTKALQANAMARASVAEASFLGGMGATGAMPVVGVVQGSNAASTLSAKRASADSQLAAAQGRYSAAQGKLDAARHGEFVAKGNVQSAFNKLQAARAGGADASTIKAFEKLHQRYTKQYDGFIKAQGTSHAALLRADTAVIAAKQAQAAAIVKQTALGWNMSTTGAAVSAVPLTAAAPGLMSRMGNGIGRGAMGMGTAGLGMAASAGGAAWGIITAAAGIAGVSVALAGAAGSTERLWRASTQADNTLLKFADTMTTGAYGIRQLDSGLSGTEASIGYFAGAMSDLTLGAYDGGVALMKWTGTFGAVQGKLEQWFYGMDKIREKSKKLDEELARSKQIGNDLTDSRKYKAALFKDKSSEEMVYEAHDAYRAALDPEYAKIKLYQDQDKKQQENIKKVNEIYAKEQEIEKAKREASRLEQDFLKFQKGVDGNRQETRNVLDEEGNVVTEIHDGKERNVTETLTVRDWHRIDQTKANEAVNKLLEQKKALQEEQVGLIGEQADIDKKILDEQRTLYDSYKRRSSDARELLFDFNYDNASASEKRKMARGQFNSNLAAFESATNFEEREKYLAEAQKSLGRMQGLNGGGGPSISTVSKTTAAAIEASSVAAKELMSRSWQTTTERFQNSVTKELEKMRKALESQLRFAEKEEKEYATIVVTPNRY